VVKDVELDLFNAYRAGNREALACVYRRYAPGVRKYLANRVGAVEHVADVVQEVFIRVFSETTRAAYDTERDFGPFLRVVARNVFLDWVRRSRREVAVESDVLETAMSEAADDDEFDPWLGEASLDVDAARHYVSTLGPGLKRVYEERFVHARTQQQAASVLGISRQALRTRESKLLAGLRRMLQVRKARSTARESRLKRPGS